MNQAIDTLPELGASIYQDMQHAREAAEMIKALAHPERLRMVALLCAGPEHVSGIAQRLGLKQSIVSQQLRILRMNGLVTSQRQAGFTFYRLAETRLRDLIRCIESCPIR